MQHQRIPGDRRICHESVKLAAFDRFTGFDSGSQKAARIPEQFFTALLPIIESLDELKLALAVIYLSAERWRTSPGFSVAALESEPLVRLIRKRSSSGESLNDTLGRLLRAGVVIEVTRPGQQEMRFALNSARGRKLIGREPSAAPRDSRDSDQTRESDRPTNIFSLYEDTVGTISPLLVDDLRQAEKLYPPDWVEEAFTQAVKYNKRSWRYVQTILERWARDGK